MRITMAVAAAALLLTACGEDNSPPSKRQPGSWSQKIDIVEFTGPGIDAAQKTQLQQMMTMASSMSVCITPEAAAREDIEKNLTSMGGQAGSCTVTDKKIAGTKLAFTANCKDKGKDVRITADGTNTPTEQNVRMTVETVGATKEAGKLVMSITAKRNGDCKPGEFTPPAPAAEPTKAPS